MAHNTDADLIGTLASAINASANAMGRLTLVIEESWAVANGQKQPMAKNSRWPKTADGQKQPMAKNSRWPKTADGQKQLMANNSRWPKTANDQKQPMAVQGCKLQSILPNAQYPWRPIEPLVTDVLSKTSTRH
jgi:hypothetical protein